MWQQGSIKIDIWEVASSQASTKSKKVVLAPGRRGVKGPHTLTLTPGALATAIVRASVTRQRDPVAAKWRAKAAYATLQASIHASAGRLYAMQGLTIDLRDSARTSWSGAAGQGLSWYAALKHFNCGQVVDFGVGCALLQPTVPAPKENESRPDFMGTSNGFSSVMLFESKGTSAEKASSVSAKADLKRGLEQTTAGQDRLAAHGHAATATNQYSVWFALLENDPVVGAFADPPGEVPPPLPVECRRALLLEHYAIWCLSAGDLEFGEQLRRGDASQRFHDLPTLEHRGRPFRYLPIVDWDFFPWFLGFPDPFQHPWLHAIDARIADLLATGAHPAEVEGARQEFVRWSSDQSAEGDVDSRVLLPDGTVYLPFG